MVIWLDGCLTPCWENLSAKRTLVRFTILDWKGRRAGLGCPRVQPLGLWWASPPDPGPAFPGLWCPPAALLWLSEPWKGVSTNRRPALTVPTRQGETTLTTQRDPPQENTRTWTRVCTHTLTSVTCVTQNEAWGLSYLAFCIHTQGPTTERFTQWWVKRSRCRKKSKEAQPEALGLPPSGSSASWPACFL